MLDELDLREHKASREAAPASSHGVYPNGTRLRPSIDEKTIKVIDENSRPNGTADQSPGRSPGNRPGTSDPRPEGTPHAGNAGDR